MTYNLSYISRQMRAILQPAIDHSHYKEKALSCNCVHKGYVVPFYHWRESIGGVADEQGNLILDSTNAEWKEKNNPHINDVPEVKHKDAVFLGVIIAGFGHTFTDDLRKLWFLETIEFKRLVENGAELVYVTDFNQELPSYAVQILKYAGFDITKAIRIDSLTQYDNVYVPDNSFFAEEYGRCYTKEYVHSVNTIKASVNEIKSQTLEHEKLYLSRRHYSQLPQSQKEQGEDVVEKQFNKLGYTSVFPEDYSFAEQVYMIQHCKQIATTEGSIAHIVAFCQPNTDVVIICKALYLNYHQVAINQLADINVTYIQAHQSHKMDKEIPWYGPFYLCVTRYLEKYLGHRVLHFPYWLCPSFWKYMRYGPRMVNKVRKLFGLPLR